MLVIFLLPALFFFLVCRPGEKEYARLQAQEKSLNQEIRDAQAEINQLPETRKEIELLRERLDKLKRQYPRTIEPFYEQISSTAKKAGMDILSMVSVPPTGPQENTLAVEKRFVRIEAHCSYQILGDFLDEISNLPVTVSISALTVVGKRSLLPRLEVELLLTTYLSTED